jgi:type II secretory pathway component GspD/PulD (secretin)
VQISRYRERESVPVVAALLLLAGLAAPLPAQEADDPAANAGEQAEAADAQPEDAQPDDVAELDEEFEIGPFAEPIDINAFVDLVAGALDINVTKDASLAGQIAFNSTMTISKRDLLPLLDLRLEELGFTIVPDPLGFYTIRRADQIVVNPGDDPNATTRFIATPGLRPSALTSLLATQLPLNRVSYEDELGVIVVTDTPRKIAQLESLVEALIEQRRSMITETIPLTYISAPVALDRAIERLGGSKTARPQNNQQVQQQNAQANALGLQTGGGLTNLAQRLTTDPAGNALIFWGLPEELEGVRAIIAAVDRRNDLISEKYFTGSATRVIADLAERQGFGRVIEAPQETQASNFFGPNRFQQEINNQLNQPSDAGESGGSQLLVDRSEGMITYFGTTEQQASFATLIEGFDTEDEIIVVEPYKLRYSDAADVAEILQSLISRSSPQGEDNPFLPQNQAAQARQFQQFFDPDAPSASEDGISILGNDSFVYADEANNQVLVQAPRSQQEAFARLIDQIDLRRPQVYIEATIIAVTATASAHRPTSVSRRPAPAASPTRAPSRPGSAG